MFPEKNRKHIAQRESYKHDSHWFCITYVMKHMSYFITDRMYYSLANKVAGEHAHKYRYASR